MPHSSKPRYVLDCEWDCEEKVQSRSISIINLYRDIYGKDSIPAEKQYWTMCGAHFNKQGKINGEFGHVTETGLIRPDQFFGIDREEVIIENNSKLYPDANWFNGDFLEVMESYDGFNPAIINYDGVMQPRFGSQYLKSIMKFIDYNVETSLLLISTFLLTNSYAYNTELKFTIEFVINELSSIYWIPDHWIMIPQAYLYSRSRTSRMGMLMFIKNEHSVNEINITKDRRLTYAHSV